MPKSLLVSKMGIATVIVSFVSCLFLNVFLNSFDVYSDITLTIKTLTFNLGDTLLLTGCKICHNKEYEDIYNPRNKSCKQCVSENYAFQCGQSYEMLNKLNELEKSDSCKEEHYSLHYNPTSHDFVFKNEECDIYKDVCCVQNSNKTLFTNPLRSLDKRILAFNYKYLQNVGYQDIGTMVQVSKSLIPENITFFCFLK